MLGSLGATYLTEWGQFYSENTWLFIEDHAISQTFDFAPPSPPPPLPSASSTRRHTARQEMRDNLLTGDGGEGWWWRGAKSYDGDNALSSLYHSVFYVFFYNQCCGSMTFWCGSMPLTNRSWSGSFYFHHWPSKCQQKSNLKKVFWILLSEGTFTSFFKGKKTNRSHKTVEIKVFLTFFA